MFKKLAASKLLRVLISVTLIYFAFRKVNIANILIGLRDIPIKWVVLNILYTIIIIIIGSYRWSVLLFKKTNWKQVFDFTKASFSGAFYGIFFPTGVAGDLLKWVPLQKKYPELTKSKLLGSVFMDRVIGFTAFIFVAFIAACIGKFLKFQFPDYLFWLFGLMFFGVIVFYFLVFNFDFAKILAKFEKYRITSKIQNLVDAVKSNDKKTIFKCLLIAFISEFVWITQVWFVSNIFNAGFNFLSVFIFLPIIAMILVLPISIAGFGAREHLYLFFFSQVVSSGNEKILLVSTFMGILGVFSALFGGLLTLF